MKKANMEFQQGIQVMREIAVSHLVSEGQRAGFHAYVLSSPAVLDRESFFLAIRSCLPLDPPILGTDNWDALQDSIWSGLDEAPDKKVLIVLPSSASFEKNAPGDFETACDVLAKVAEQLADPVATVGAPKILAVVVC
jgi:hypothetical protein